MGRGSLCIKSARVLIIFSFAIFSLVCINSHGVIYISSIEELQKIGEDPNYPLNGEYELTQDIDASDTINWNNGAGFDPIGSWDNRFIGVFDGKGHVIRNLYINRRDENNVGLFGYVGSGGEVRNLGLENVQVVGGYWGVGGLVGWNYYGTVSECYSVGSVLGIGDGVGGLVGENDYGTVSQCYSAGSVSGDRYVGGLVGYNDYGTVSQCYSAGSVSGSGWYVGGLVGRNSGTVSQCYSVGSVSGIGVVGGLVGGNDYGTVSQCYSAGRVSGSGDYVGGLVGYNDYDGTVSSSYWDVEASGQSSSAGGVGKTTAEMKQQATYEGWDFANVWDIVEGQGYPYLRVLGETVYPVVVEREIWGLDELAKIGRDWDYPMDGRYKLMVDIDASETIGWDGGKGFKPLVFIGSFDGNGHVIRNLYINRVGEGGVGLFGYVGSGGEVRNLGLENVQVVGGRRRCVVGMSVVLWGGM